MRDGHQTLRDRKVGESTPGAKPRILIMDDEKHIRTTLTLMLRMFGLEVTTAAEGGEAVNLYRQAMDEERSFDCVMLDLSVPTGLNGLETLAQLLKLDPEVRAILCSGSLSGQVGMYRDLGFREVVPKPFTSDGLRQTIRGVLCT